jgi:hypothetical protein
MPKVDFDKKTERPKKPFKKAKEVGRRLKLFVFGDTGTHKTILSIGFPKPVVIDLEKGTEHYGKDFDFDVPPEPPETWQDTMDLVDWLKTANHGYRTLVIDPITVLWEFCQKKWSDIFLKRNRSSKGFKHEFYNLQPTDWMTVKADWKAFIQILLALDMNVIVTAREKPEYADGELMRKVGVTYDGEKNLKYFFDTVLRLYKGDNGTFMAECKKDRTNNFKEGQEIKNPTYATFEGLFGKQALTRKAKVEKKLAKASDKKGDSPTPSQQAEEKADSKAEKRPHIADRIQKEVRENIVKHLRELGSTRGQVKKALAAYGCQSLDDLSDDQAQEIEAKLSLSVKMNREQESRKK